MKNPITRIIYLLFSISLMYAFFKQSVSFEKFELMVYLVGSITFALVIRAETLGEVFVNISEALKEKWRK